MTPEARMLKQLRDQKWSFGVMRSRKLYGGVEYGRKTLLINPVGHIISTLVHELLHVVDPKASENVILARECDRRKELSLQDEDAILHAFSPDLLRVMNQIHKIRGGL